MDRRWVRLPDDTVWAVTTDRTESMWKMRYGKPSRNDMYAVVEMAETYDHLLNHPAMSLKRIAKIISGIRKAQKGDTNGEG